LPWSWQNTPRRFSDIKSVGSISPGKAIIGGIARLDIGGWPLIHITDIQLVENEKNEYVRGYGAAPRRVLLHITTRSTKESATRTWEGGSGFLELIAFFILFLAHLN